MKKLMVVLAAMLAMGIQVGYSNENREIKGKETAVEHEDSFVYIAQACTKDGECIRVKIKEEDTSFGTMAYVIAYYSSAYRRWVDPPYSVRVSEDFQGNRSFYLNLRTYYL